jgi:hypothetical protein
VREANAIPVMYKTYVQFFGLAFPAQLIVGSVVYLMLPEYRYLLIEEDQLIRESNCSVLPD